MKVPVAPFLTPPSDAVSHGGWFITSEAGDTPLTAEIAHWDYQTILALAAPVSVDRVRVTDACSLGLDSGLAVLVMARSTHTRTERLVSRLEVPHRDRFDLAVEFEIHGAELGGRLILETQLVVVDPRPLNGLAPWQPGSIIWRAQHHTDLEGIGAQFPTDSADFRLTHQADPKAGWELRVDLSDPDALFMSAVRLTLNSGHPAVARLLQGARDDRTDQLLRTLNWDVTRQLVYLALNSDDVASCDIDPEALSVASVLRNLLAAIWPRESVMTLRTWAVQDASRLEVHLQHHLRLIP